MYIKMIFSLSSAKWRYYLNWAPSLFSSFSRKRNCRYNSNEIVWGFFSTFSLLLFIWWPRKIVNLCEECLNFFLNSYVNVNAQIWILNDFSCILLPFLYAMLQRGIRKSHVNCNLLEDRSLCSRSVHCTTKNTMKRRSC